MAQEIAARYLEGLFKHWVWGATALVVLLAFAALELGQRKLTGTTAARLRGVALLSVCALAVYHAWTLRWIADDAFISFRYARNLVEGKGLVFNEGARVEGYTNFSWTLVLAGLGVLGANPAQASVVLSLLCLVGALVFTTRLVWLHCETVERPLVSIAAVLLAANYTFASFGTSGLETMLGTLLTLAALERAEAGRLLASGTLGILATLTHPDHAIFYAVLGAALCLRAGLGQSLIALARRPSTDFSRNLAGYAAPFFLLYVPYLAWKYWYYGSFFPNTYYTKSASLWYFRQGSNYLVISGVAAGVILVLPVLIYGCIRFRRTLTVQFALAALPLYLIYVAKIGGDFMLGRLLCPVLPLGLIIAELGTRALLTGDRPRAIWGLATLPGLALVALPIPLVRPHEKFHHVADERTYYRLESFDPIVVKTGQTRQAEAFERAFANAPRPPVLGIGCVGIVGWKTNLPIFDNLGLVEPSVAHMPIQKRGRPGHEKLASLGHALAGGADFSDVNKFPEPYQRHAKALVQGARMTLLKYDAAFLAPLRKERAIDVPDFPRWVKTWSPPADPERAQCDAWFMSQFYFSVNPASETRALRREVLRRLGKSSSPAIGDWILTGDGAALATLTRVRHWPFDQPLGPEWQTTGTAFDAAPSSTLAPGQGLVFDHEGPFLNSFHPRLGDVAQGSVTSPGFDLQGAWLTLRVSGGRDADKLAVRLLVDGVEVERATGCQADPMRRWAWDIRAHRGKTGQLEIVDATSDKWGHIAVDDVSEWTQAEQEGEAPEPLK